MYKTLLIFETRIWLLRKATIFVLLLWLVVLLFALSNGARQATARQQRIDSLTAVEQDRFQKHPLLMDSFATGKKTAGVYWDDARNAYDIGYIYGKKYIFMPNSQFILATGQSTLHHSDHELTTAAEFWFSALRKAERMDNPVNTIYGAFDLAFVLVWLMPLLCIVFTFNVLSIEREQGTLKMLLIQGGSARTLLIFRVGYRLAVLLIFTMVTVLMGSMLMSKSLSPMAWLYFFLFTSFYMLLWHGISLFVNLFNRSSNYNAGVLFTCWIAVVLVIPALLNVIVTNVTPVPGKVLLQNEVRAILTENDQKNAAILDQFYTDHPEFVIKDSSKLMPLFMYKYMIKEMTTSEQLQPVMNEYKTKLEQQSKTVNRLAVLVPSMAYQEALEELSNTSLSQYIAFERFVDAASRAWRNLFHPLSLANKYLTVNEYKNLPAPVFIARIDQGKNILLLVSLVVWNAMIFTLTIRKLFRYKIE